MACATAGILTLIFDDMLCRGANRADFLGQQGAANVEEDNDGEKETNMETNEEDNKETAEEINARKRKEVLAAREEQKRQKLNREKEETEQKKKILAEQKRILEMLEVCLSPIFRVRVQWDLVLYCGDKRTLSLS